MHDLLGRESDGQSRRSRRRVWLTFALVALAAVVAFVLVWFQPHKRFIDDRVSEAIPTVAPPTAPPARSGPTSSPASREGAEPVEIFRGELVSLDHSTSGVVRVLDLADGRRLVRLEGLDTDNGPDLYLYLTTNPAGGVETAFDDDYVNLGRLKGSLGDQNYALATDADLDRYGTIVIWCDRFNSAFGAADLTSA